MNLRIVAPLALALLATLATTQVERSEIRPGDLLNIHVDRFEKYSGEFLVTSDGNISYTNIGRVDAAGRTLAEIEAELTAKLSKIILRPQVTVSIISERASYVYVAGDLTSEGAIGWRPGMDLREVLAAVRMPEGYDQYMVSVFREGEKILTEEVYDLLTQADSPANIAVEPNDVVTVLAKEYIRTWVTGAVSSAGRIKLPLGSDAHQAVAAAGGIYGDLRLSDEVEIVVRRGPEEIVLPAIPTEPDDYLTLEPGDSIYVRAPEQVRVSIGGEVAAPAEYSLTANESLNSAIAQAGGPTGRGTLRRVLVIRGRETYMIDASKPTTGQATEPFQLQDGDFVFVQPNRDYATVLGFASSPGPVYFEDGRDYRLSDVIASANGVSSGGSLYRVYVGRPGEDGKVQVEMYHLDLYFKEGDLSQNPQVLPGDVVLVGQPKGITFRDVSRAISSALLLDSIFGGGGDGVPPR